MNNDDSRIKSVGGLAELSEAARLQAAERLKAGHRRGARPKDAIPKESLKLRLPRSLLDQLTGLAEREQRSLNGQIVVMLTRGIDQW
jgi:hypothetical protein